MESSVESVISVVSWNLLAQKFVADRIEWSTRCARIICMLLDVHPDLILLQEVGMQTFEADFEQLIHATDGLYDYVRHRSKKNRRNCQACVILWRRTTFQKQPDQTESTSHKSVHCVLLHRATQRPLTVVNLHLKAGLNSQEETRVTELETALSQCVLDDDAHCLVLGGDLNDDLQTGRRLYPILTETGGLSGGSQQSLDTPACCFVNGTYHAFDHLLTRGATLKRLHYDTPYTNTSQDEPAIPNSIFPSDHLMLRLVMTLK